MNKNLLGMLAVCGLLSSPITFAISSAEPVENSEKAMKARCKQLAKKAKRGEQLTAGEQQQLDAWSAKKASKKEEKSKMKLLKKKVKRGEQLTPEEQQQFDEWNSKKVLKKQNKLARKQQRTAE